MRAFLAALALLSSVARAESPVEREAREHYNAAQKLFDQARYDEAVVEFGKSYELSRYPAILHKIALCHDQLGQVDQAIEFYQKYLDAEDRDNPRRAGIEARIGKLQELKQAPPPEPAPPPPTTTPAAAAPATVAVSAQAPAKKTPIHKRWWLWTIVGVAAAGLAVGLGVGLAPSKSPTPSSFVPTASPGTVGPGR